MSVPTYSFQLVICKQRHAQAKPHTEDTIQARAETLLYSETRAQHDTHIGAARAEVGVGVKRNYSSFSIPGSRSIPHPALGRAGVGSLNPWGNLIPNTLQLELDSRFPSAGTFAD